ncbi:hypothetical protein B0H14DRAFT_1216478 [Mycena olivaceomarginata]|nr:hypothetical protein B0H14DRAFT_1216478 [Mycena olivaceomarginata]
MQARYDSTPERRRFAHGTCFDIQRCCRRCTRPSPTRTPLCARRFSLCLSQCTAAPKALFPVDTPLQRQCGEFTDTRPQRSASPPSPVLHLRSTGLCICNGGSPGAPVCPHARARRYCGERGSQAADAPACPYPGIGASTLGWRNSSRRTLPMPMPGDIERPAPLPVAAPLRASARVRVLARMRGTAGVGSPSRSRRNASRSCKVTRPAPSRGSTPGFCTRTRAGSTMHGTAGVGSPSRSRRNASRSCEVTLRASRPAPSHGSTPGCCARTRAGSTMRGTLGVGSPSRSRRNTSRSCEATLGDRRCPCVCPCVRSGDRRWAWGWRWRWRQTAAVHTPRLSVTGQFPGSRCGWC